MAFSNIWFMNDYLLNKTLYFQSDNGVTIMVMKGRRQEVIDMSLVKVENMLPEGMFYRVHRSYLVNLDALLELRYYRSHLLALVGNYQIPVSRRRGKDLMDSLDIF